MKKRFLVFMIAFCLIIPCMIAFVGCGHKHTYNEQKLCDCGHYAGTTLTLGETEENITLVKDQQLFYRYKVKEGGHYLFTKTNITADEIKIYAQYKNGWVDMTQDYKVVNTLPKGGYFYVVITAQAATANGKFTMNEVEHSATYAVEGTDTLKNLDLGSVETSTNVCASISLKKGHSYKFTMDDAFASFEGVFSAEGKMNVTENDGGYILNLTKATKDFEGFVHIYINSEESTNGLTVARI